MARQKIQLYIQLVGGPANTSTGVLAATFDSMADMQASVVDVSILKLASNMADALQEAAIRHGSHAR